MVGRIFSRLAGFLQWLVASETLETLPALPRSGWHGQEKPFLGWLLGGEALPPAGDAREACPVEPRFIAYLFSRDQLPDGIPASGEKPRDATKGGR